MTSTLLAALKFLVTDACNISCSFCHNEFQGSINEQKRPSFDPKLTMDLLLAIAPDRRFSDLKISGGEPLTCIRNVRQILSIASGFSFSRRLLVSNLVAAEDAIFNDLITYGVSEIRVNIPAFSAAAYSRITRTPPKTFSKLLYGIEAAKNKGFHLRANTVVSESTVSDLSANFSDRHRLINQFDELFFIIDYRTHASTEIEQFLSMLLARHGGKKVEERKGRIDVYELDGFRISVARCTAPMRADGRDYYIKPPGVLMQSFRAGHAYKRRG